MSNDRRTTLAPAAASTLLATDFPVLDETDLTVKRTRASMTTTLTLDLDYTISGVGAPGGAFVTLVSPSLAGDTYTLDGISVTERVSDYDPEQTPSGDQLDADLNRLIHLAQENRRDILDLQLVAGVVAQIELGQQGGNVAWRPVGTTTWNVLAGLTYPPHPHVIDDVAGLQAVLDAKLPTASFTGHVHANAVSGGAAGFMTGADKAAHDKMAAGRGPVVQPLVATTSGLFVDLTGIPADANRVTLLLDGVSTNGTSHPIVQLGDSGGAENSGYTSHATNFSGSSSSVIGFHMPSILAANILHMRFVFERLDGNTWAAQWTGLTTAGAAIVGVGRKTLSAALTHLRLTTTNGTDAFDAGSATLLIG